MSNVEKLVQECKIINLDSSKHISFSIMNKLLQIIQVQRWALIEIRDVHLLSRADEALDLCEDIASVTDKSE